MHVGVCVCTYNARMFRERVYSSSKCTCAIVCVTQALIRCTQERRKHLRQREEVVVKDLKSISLDIILLCVCEECEGCALERMAVIGPPTHARANVKCGRVLVLCGG